MKNILAAIDFSNISNAVIDTAGKFAHSFSSHLWLIHVAAPDPDFVGYGVGPQNERDWRAKTLRNEHLFIQKKAKDLQNNGIEVTPLLVQGATVDTILTEASKLNADLIVVGSHGHSAIYEVLVGTVTKGLLKNSQYPVVVVPATKAHG